MYNRLHIRTRQQTDGTRLSTPNFLLYAARYSILLWKLEKSLARQCKMLEVQRKTKQFPCKETRWLDLHLIQGSCCSFSDSKNFIFSLMFSPWYCRGVTLHVICLVIQFVPVNEGLRNVHTVSLTWWETCHFIRRIQVQLKIRSSLSTDDYVLPSFGSEKYR